MKRIVLALIAALSLSSAACADVDPVWVLSIDVLTSAGERIDFDAGIPLDDRTFSDLTRCAFSLGMLSNYYISKGADVTQPYTRERDSVSLVLADGDGNSAMLRCGRLL